MTTLQGSAFISHSGGQKATNTAQRRFAVAQGDHLTLYNVYTSFVKAEMGVAWCRDNMLNHKALVKAVSVRKQLAAYLSRFGITTTSSLSSSDVLRVGGTPVEERVRRCLTTGFFAHAARMQSDGSFVGGDGKTVLWAHPSSVFFHRKAGWVVYTEVLATKDKVFIRDLSVVEREWLVEYAPEYYKVRNRGR
jgi:ATP-dependent RNA helicase DDX35